MAFIWPGLTAVVLLIFIAAWAIFTGLLEIYAAVQLRKEMQGEWLLVPASFPDSRIHPGPRAPFRGHSQSG